MKIEIDGPARPADIGSTDFTIEFWMKASLSENSSGSCSPGGDNWINGNIMFDRDVYGNGDYGDYGISLAGGRIAFGVNNGTDGTTICGATDVADGAWHHIAVTRRRSDGLLRVFVDGVLDAEEVGPDDDVSYRDGRSTQFPNDPFLVIGAEKHDAGLAYPSYNGWIDEVRVSNVLRYTGTFTRPSAPFSPDANTVALYHFDEGSGDLIADSSGAAGGPSNGTRKFGGSPAGPEWSTDVVPFGPPAITLEPVATGLANPVAITHAGDGSGRLFITLQAGKVIIHDGAGLLPTPFLDITSLVKCCGEEGLLSVAFHPNYSSTGYFFVYYTNTSGNEVVARYRVSSDPNVADLSSGVILVTISHPNFTNHNGGQLQFGPDGYLYAGVGDGGSGGDPNNNAQNLGTLLGKILRIDVDGGFPYAVPADNPFVENPDNPATRGEIWARGLRNPWRFSFDRVTGDLIIGDVGQDSREEVDFQPATSPGGENYGWRRMEGTACLIPSSGCNDGTLTLPILEYDHSGGNCSITGGYRYRGTEIPQLHGIYPYADYCSGRIWGATQSGGGGWTTSQLLDTSLFLSSFGEDEAGELYVAHLSSTSGAVYRIVSGTVPAAPEITVTPLSLAFGSVAVGATSPAQTVTVRNDGTANLTLGTLTLGGANPTQFSTPTDTCSGQTLAPGQTCTVGVRFNPTTAGAKSGTLVIPSNDPDENPVNVGLSGTGSSGAKTPDITVTPLSPAFGSVAAGTTSPAQTVTVRNDGTANLTLGTLTLGGANPGEFRKSGSQDLCSGQTLAPGQTCTVGVRFQPTSGGAKSGTLVIPSNDADENPVNVGLSGTGSSGAGPPDITVTPMSVTFGSVAVGSASATQTVTVRNDGTANLTLGTLTLGGANPTQFSKPTDTCSGQSLASAQTCTVGVRFNPTTTGAKSGTLVIPSNDADENPVNVGLSGTGSSGAGTPDITVTSLSLVFGSVAVGTTSPTQTVTVRNDGTANLTVGTVTLGGAQPGKFQLLEGQQLCSGQTLAPGQTCTVRVRFNPTTRGAKSGTLVIPSNDADENPVTVLLSGTGI